MKAKKKTKVATVEQKEPVTVRGSHLTTTTHPTGHVDLEWDFDALHRDVQAAIADYRASLKPVKRARAKKAS